MTGHDGAPGVDLVVVGDCNPDVLVLGDDVTPSFGQQEKLVEGIWMVVGAYPAIVKKGPVGGTRSLSLSRVRK